MSLKAQDVYAILNGKIEEGSSSTPTDINYNDLQNQPVYNVTVENGKFNLCNVTESGLYRLYNPNGILIMLNGLEGSNGDFTEKNMAAFSYNVIYVFINIRISTNNNKYITAKSMYGEEKRYNYISCIYTYETNTWKSEKINTVLNLDNFSEYTPKADYNPATKKYVDDTVNNEILSSQTIKAAPVTVETTGNDILVRNNYKVNILDLEYDTFYAISPSVFVEPSPDKNNVNIFIPIVLCEDGTEKTIINTNIYRIFYITKSLNNIVLRFYESNTSYVIELNGAATSSDVSVEAKYNLNYLGIYNVHEYTPTDDYHPATKKYVDDSVNNIGTTKVNTSQGIENAGKVLGINEEGNVVPVDASSGSGSGSIFNESIVVNEDGEIEVITTIPTIYVNMETANLETDSNVFSVDKNGYLISSK